MNIEERKRMLHVMLPLLTVLQKWTEVQVDLLSVKPGQRLVASSTLVRRQQFLDVDDTEVRLEHLIATMRILARATLTLASSCQMNVRIFVHLSLEEDQLEEIAVRTAKIGEDVKVQRSGGADAYLLIILISFQLSLIVWNTVLHAFEVFENVDAGLVSDQQWTSMLNLVSQLPERRDGHEMYASVAAADRLSPKAWPLYVIFRLVVEICVSLQEEEDDGPRLPTHLVLKELDILSVGGIVHPHELVFVLVRHLDDHELIAFEFKLLPIDMYRVVT